MKNKNKPGMFKEQSCLDEQVLRQPKEFQDAAKQGKIKWQKDKNKMTHLTPKKKKRKN